MPTPPLLARSLFLLAIRTTRMDMSLIGSEIKDAPLGVFPIEKKSGTSQPSLSKRCWAWVVPNEFRLIHVICVFDSV